MAALAGGEGMIGLLAAIALQTAQPPLMIAPAPRDLPAYVESELGLCRINQRPWTGPGRRVSNQRSEGRTRGGTIVQVATSEGRCSIWTTAWRSRGDHLPVVVRDSLGDWEPAFATSEWRQAFQSDGGAAIRTVFEQRNAHGALTGRVEVIEPAEGTIGPAGVRYEAVEP
jgi:hypothetical protein